MITRDFIYLDAERARSLFAQIEEGVVETSSTEAGSEQKIGGKLKGKVPFIAGAEATGDTLWNRKDTETRTLHDHMFNHIEDRLLKTKQLVDFSSKYENNWDREHFVSSLLPTSFIKIRGTVRLNDFGAMSKLLDEFHEMAHIIASFAMLDQSTSNPKMQKQAQQNFLQGMPDKKTLKNLASMVTRFYGKAIVLKMWPLKDINDCAFVCRLNEDYLRESISDLTYKFGASPEDPWVLVGQVARIASLEDKPENIQLQNVQDDFDKAIEEMFDAARELFNVSTVKYPYISLTPLAVYRE